MVLKDFPIVGEKLRLLLPVQHPGSAEDEDSGKEHQIRSERQACRFTIIHACGEKDDDPADQDYSDSCGYDGITSHHDRFFRIRFNPAINEIFFAVIARAAKQSCTGDQIILLSGPAQ
jgi:hypothetical protein